MSKPPTQPKRPSTVFLAFDTLRRTLKHSYENLLTMFVLGAIWYLGAFVLVPLAPFTAGIHRVTQRMSEERVGNWRDMFAELRRDLGWSWTLTTALLLILMLLIINLSFYAESTTPYLAYLSITFILFTFLWIGIMLVAFPLALRQTDRRARTTLRNAFVVLFANLPGMLVSLLLLVITTTLLFALPPLFLLVPSWIALWGEEQTRLLLVRAGHLQPDEIADRVGE